MYLSCPVNERSEIILILLKQSQAFSLKLMSSFAVMQNLAVYEIIKSVFVFHEVKDLVYNKHSADLLGFVQIGDVNDH